MDRKEYLKKQYYITNKEKILKRTKQYKLENRDIIKERSKQYYIANKERIKQHYIKNREKILEQKKQYHIVNKEKILKQKKQYGLNNKEKIKDKNKRYYIDNKEKLRKRNKIWIQEHQLKFLDKKITLDNIERSFHCICCRFQGSTNLHHLKYDLNDPLKHTVELCDSCHLLWHIEENYLRFGKKGILSSKELMVENTINLDELEERQGDEGFE